MSGRVSPVLFFQNPMGEIDEQLVDDELFIDEDDLTPRAIESGSPGDIIRVLHTPPPFEDKEAERALAEFEHEMTDNELSDLTYAFQSCDIDGAGTIEPPELYAMMAVLGAEVDLKTVQLVMKESTHKFKGWLAAQQAKEAVAGLALPDELVHDEKESGHHGSTKHGGKRHHTELVELKKKHPLIVLGLHPLMTPVRVPMKYSAKIVYISGKVMAAPFEGLFKEEEEEYSGLSAVEKAAAIEAAMLSDQHMVFSEFMYMMGHREVLDNLVPGDWHKQADKMRKYRHAFDTADVDGSLDLDFEKLDMVVLSLDSEHNLTHEDMLYYWGVLSQRDETPTREEAEKMEGLSFNGFLHGMARAQKDPTCCTWMNMDKPNKWEMLSLLIDTPVSAAEEQRILAGLDVIDKLGINMIKKQHSEMDREHMREVLTRAGEGKLRVLNEQQVDRMTSLKSSAILLSGLIGLICCIIPAYMENYLCEEFGVDGFKDTYWVCHEQSHRVTNGTDFELDDWYEPSTPLDPDEMLCTTVHVNMTSCLGNYYDDEVVVIDKEKYDSGPPDYKFVNKDFYPRGLATEDKHREGYRSVQFDPFVKKLDANYNSIKKICSNCECWVCACVSHEDGVIDVAADNKLITWWVILGITIALNIVFELGFLMYYAVYYATRVAWAIDIRLHPLNADRAFVADSLVRAAFELGNPESVVMGVDPHAADDGHTFKIAALALYKGKALITGLLLKAIVGKVTEPEFALWWKPWLGMVTATIIWDSLIAHCIILQAQIRGFGIFTSCECFNEIMDLHYVDKKEISELGKVQIARACGIAIVKKGSMYPTLEVLLRHSIQYLGLRGKAVVANPGVLDSVEDFLNDMQDCSAEDHKAACLANNLTKDDEVVILSVLLLALILDGNVGRAEQALWKQACEVADDSVAKFYPERLKHISTMFREFRAISATDLKNCFDPKAEYEVTGSTHLKQFWFDVGQCLSC